MDENKLAEIATAEASRHDPEVMTKPFGYNWGHAYWGKWQTISYALAALGIPTGASILDVGMGVGWTTVFLAESGFRPTGIDIAPASAAIAKARANRCGVDVGALVADMDDFDLGQTFDAALVFDALHHSNQQAKVIRNVAQHIRPGGWVLFGEPSWLHDLSPGTRRVHREVGWVERGVKVRNLKRDCRKAALGDFRRFYEGTQPHAGRARDFAYQTARLLAARAACAPQMSVWYAARRLGPATARS